MAAISGAACGTLLGLPTWGCVREDRGEEEREEKERVNKKYEFPFSERERELP